MEGSRVNQISRGTIIGVILAKQEERLDASLDNVDSMLVCEKPFTFGSDIQIKYVPDMLRLHHSLHQGTLENSVAN